MDKGYLQYTNKNLKSMLCNIKKAMYGEKDPVQKQESLDLIDSIENELCRRGLKYSDISMIGEIRISVGYINPMDKSVIFETVFNENGEIKSEEIVGWYFGRPNEKDTEKFANRNMKADF